MVSGQQSPDKGESKSPEQSPGFSSVKTLEKCLSTGDILLLEKTSQTLAWPASLNWVWIRRRVHSGTLKTHHFLASFSSFSTSHSHLLEAVAPSTSCPQEQCQLHPMPVAGRPAVAVGGEGEAGEGSNGWKVCLLPEAASAAADHSLPLEETFVSSSVIHPRIAIPSPPGKRPDGSVLYARFDYGLPVGPHWVGQEGPLALHQKFQGFLAKAHAAWPGLKSRRSCLPISFPPVRPL